ncbi:MAG TPA: glucose 1-dehydrogenase [Stellaceae bacterium]|nr:glucose 1-dehydrogenase [Stellaceae bacterium]
MIGPDAFRLDGKVALVTGAGRGLGRGIAMALAGAGAELLLNSRSPAELEAVAAEITAAGGKARSLPFDVTDTVKMRAAIDSVAKEVGRIDILVNNAGVNRPQPFLDVDETTLDRLLALNVRALFLTAQAAARRMAEGGGGVIINMSSQMGHVGSERDRTVYVMTKHAVEGLTKAMAVELAPHNIRVVTIAPTFIETPLTKPFFDDPATRKWILDRIPRGRAGTIEEVANAVMFLASPAARLVTGSSLLADGGWTAW